MITGKDLLKFYIVTNVLFYFLPAFLSLFFFKTTYFYHSLELIIIFLISLVFFTFGFNVFKSHFLKFNINNIKLSIKVLYFLLIVYFFVVYKVFTDTPPALFHVLTGDYKMINELRAFATKNKTGIDSFYNGIYFTLSYVVLPCLLLYVYQKKYKYKHLIFVFFTFILMLNMQKARIIYLIIPLLFLFIKKVPKIKLIRYSLFFLFFLILISGLTGFNSERDIILSDNLFIRSTTNARFLFENFTSFNFVINRIFWIPFITAVDWISFYYVEVNHYLNGATIPLFYKIFGHESRFLIENEVFKYSYGASDGSLGTANSHFALDAYLNFGFLGVLFYSFLAGGIISSLFYLLPKPINIVIFNYAYAISFSSLHANFMGGGLWLLILFVMFIGIKRRR